jgi:repressor LexA
MSTRPVSDVQRRILDAIRDFADENNRPPTIREIQQMAGLSTPSLVKYHLDILMEGGHVTHRPGTARGVEVVADAEARKRATLINVRIVGAIAAGAPISAIESPEDLYLTPDVARIGDYALRVRGNSMIEDHIEDGDIVIVRAQESADDGDTVVALLLNGNGDLAGEATLKRLYHEPAKDTNGRGRIRLQPRNAAMQPIYVDPLNLRIRGKVVGVIRLLA